MISSPRQRRARGDHRRRTRPLTVRRRTPGLAIARALLKDPPILIFDEATCALDADDRTAIAARDDEGATQGRTTFIIAHRLATVRNRRSASSFSTSGRIVEQGSYEDLIVRGGRFAKLASAQNVLQTPELDFEAVSAGVRPENF